MDATAKTFSLSTLAGIATLFAAATTLPARAQDGAAPRPFQFNGTDGNWFNPRNWSTGRVPGATDDVVLDKGDLVVIDTLDDPTPVTVRDLTVRDNAQLVGLNGAILTTRNEILQDSGDIVFRASAEAGDGLIVAPFSDPDSCSDCTLVMNPNPKSKRVVVLQSSVTVDMGLGGTTPASLTQDATGAPVLNAGAGTYSTMTAETLVLDGQLRLSTYYGFRPAPGQVFNLFTATRTRVGTFDGLAEGSFAGCTDTNVCLRISYRGGDGNDVVLTAESVSPVIGLLVPAIQKIRQATNTVQTREHVLLAKCIC